MKQKVHGKWKWNATSDLSQERIDGPTSDEQGWNQERSLQTKDEYEEDEQDAAGFLTRVK